MNINERKTPKSSKNYTLNIGPIGGLYVTKDLIDSLNLNKKSNYLKKICELSKDIKRICKECNKLSKIIMTGLCGCCLWKKVLLRFK